MTLLQSEPRLSRAPASQRNLTQPVAGPPARDRTLLVIANRFPPMASVGAVRVRKFCLYLRGHGWWPVVITAAAEADPSGAAESTRVARDFDSMADVPADMPVHRLPRETGAWPQAGTRRWARRLGRWTRWAGLTERWWEEGLSWRVQRCWRWLSFPDAGVWGLREAVTAAEALHARFRFSAVWSSAMPFSDHVIAMAVRRRLNLPWVADFRDPWVEYVHDPATRTRLDRWRQRRGESAVVRAADRVVSIGEVMTARFRERYPELPAERFVTIRNGFDPEDFRVVSGDSATNDGVLRVLYTGSFYAGRGPMPLIEGLTRVLATSPATRDAMRLEFAGRMGPWADALHAAAARLPVRVHGLLSHREATALMRRCDVMVVIQDDRPGTEIDLSAKTYEYLGSGKPILALVGAGGEAERLLLQFDGIWLAPPGDITRIAAHLRDIFDAWRARRLAPQRDPASLRPLTRQFQARQLAELLNELIEARQ